MKNEIQVNTWQKSKWAQLMALQPIIALQTNLLDPGIDLGLENACGR